MLRLSFRLEVQLQSFPLANVGDVKLDQILQGIDNLAFDGKNLMVTIGNVIPGNHINARGYFTAMMIGF